MHFTLMQSLRFFIKVAERFHAVTFGWSLFQIQMLYWGWNIKNSESYPKDGSKFNILKTCYNETIAPYRRTDPRREFRLVYRVSHRSFFALDYRMLQTDITFVWKETHFEKPMHSKTTWTKLFKGFNYSVY